MELIGLSTPSTHPHEQMPAHYSGVPLSESDSALILVHGRGATAESIEPLAHHLGLPKTTAVICPQAANNTWYPFSFVAAREDNEPYLTSALLVVQRLLTDVLTQGIDPARVILGGFSQGACLVSEVVARSTIPLGGLLAFSGGVIGQDIDMALKREGQPLSNMPVFLGCSDIDMHIPEERVQDTAALFQQLGASVNCKIYPGMSHTIIADELDQASQIIAQRLS